MSLLEVITDDTAICWFDGSVGLPGSTILIDNPAEFWEFHLNRIYYSI